MHVSLLIIYEDGASSMEFTLDKKNDNVVVFNKKKNAIFCWKMDVCVVTYRSEGKNTTQGNIAELVGSTVELIGVSGSPSLRVSVSCLLQSL